MSAPPDRSVIAARYVALHNEGVSTGDFSALGALFADDAVLEFHGIALGPFRGRKEILEAFARYPPTDRLVLLDPPRVSPSQLVIGYTWQSAPNQPAGSLQLEHADDVITRLIITVGGDLPETPSAP